MPGVACGEHTPKIEADTGKAEREQGKGKRHHAKMKPHKVDTFQANQGDICQGLHVWESTHFQAPHFRTWVLTTEHAGRIPCLQKLTEKSHRKQVIETHGNWRGSRKDIGTGRSVTGMKVVSHCRQFKVCRTGLRSTNCLISAAWLCKSYLILQCVVETPKLGFMLCHSG